MALEAHASLRGEGMLAGAMQAGAEEGAQGRGVLHAPALPHDCTAEAARTGGAALAASPGWARPARGRLQSVDIFWDAQFLGLGQWSKCGKGSSRAA